MANYVANKIVCKKDFYTSYLMDYNPFDNEIPLDEPYISFNKILNIKNVSDSNTHIYYGCGFDISEIDSETVEVKFKTRWDYPIEAIIASIKIDHSVIWYAVEECNTYLSKFIWDNDKVIEKEYSLTYKEYEDWFTDFEYPLEDYDCPLWHYNNIVENNWTISDSDDLIKKYSEDVY